MTALPFRLLTRDDLKAMCGGISESTLLRWLREGILPPPIAGTTRWHPVAVEQALARRAGLAETARSDEDDPFLAGLKGEGRV